MEDQDINDSRYDSSSHNGSEYDDRYNPYEEYVRQKVEESMHEDLGGSYRKYPNDENDPDDFFRKAKIKARPNKLSVAALSLSIISLLCCCGNFYVTICGSIMAIVIAVCSRFFNNDEKRFHPYAIAAIVIGMLSIVIIIIMLYFYLEVYPDLLKDPSYQKLLEQMLEQINGSQDVLPSSAGPQI